MQRCSGPYYNEIRRWISIRTSGIELIILLYGHNGDIILQFRVELPDQVNSSGAAGATPNYDISIEFEFHYMLVQSQYQESCSQDKFLYTSAIAS